jgi:plasmid maintenance system antidote protein VapI
MNAHLEYKIHDPAEQLVTEQPDLDRAPGVYIRDVILPQHGLRKIAPLAELLKVNRPNLHQVLSGDRDVSRELAYRLGALLGDSVADFVIGYQQSWDLQQERGRREELKREIARFEREFEA